MIKWIKGLFGVSEANSNVLDASLKAVGEHSSLNHAHNAEITEITEINQSLLEYFRDLTIKEHRPNIIYHGGHHDPSVSVEGALWFHLEKDKNIAESYMNWGDSENPKLKKTLLIAEPIKTLKLLEFPGNHVEILRQIYRKPWNHAQLAKDVTAIGDPSVLGFDGFFRPRSDEYFVINVQDNLKFIKNSE
ncbi:hypothetical protein [Shewanella sp. YLB-07]|uniref:hypothetical protein n=1 Tax=Shewanella sp. YLB-07 TaxID=2601268 RepID=UPI00128D7F33|nr:hypothetical protein [Shewanella sp. YLB-07]MPY24460.1 hypothetical protein [Shewanella sp. YLB-07]